MLGTQLVERLDDLRPKDLEKRLRLANPPLILVLPGSREGEIRRMTSVFGQAIARVIERFGPAEVVVPAVFQACGYRAGSRRIVVRAGPRGNGCGRKG